MIVRRGLGMLPDPNCLLCRFGIALCFIGRTLLFSLPPAAAVFLNLSRRQFTAAYVSTPVFPA